MTSQACSWATRPCRVVERRSPSSITTRAGAVVARTCGGGPAAGPSGPPSRANAVASCSNMSSPQHAETRAPSGPAEECDESSVGGDEVRSAAADPRLAVRGLAPHAPLDLLCGVGLVRALADLVADAAEERPEGLHVDDFRGSGDPQRVMQ